MSRILVVEDEESYSDPLSYLLRREGYEVSVAETGPAALALFDSNGADLVLLDQQSSVVATVCRGEVAHNIAPDRLKGPGTRRRRSRGAV